MIDAAVSGTGLTTFDRSGIHRGADGVARYQNRPNSLVESLRATVDRQPDAEAVVELGGERVTYRQLWDRAASVAAGLRDTGVRSGDRVLIRLVNGLDWCTAFFGALLAGAVAVPVNPRLTDPEIAYIHDDAGAAHVIDAAGLPAGRGAPDVTPGPDDTAAIFYTSGTTGRPKGAVTSHANFLTNSETARRVLGIEGPDPWRSLVSVPLHHVTGCNSQLLPACEFGGTTVIMPSFHAPEFLRVIHEERITALMSVPSVYQMALASSALKRIDTTVVRSLTYGGAPMQPELVARIREGFPKARLGSGYGLTESSSFTAYLPHEEVVRTPDAVGIPVPVVDLALADRRDDGVGELLVRGPNVVHGYWGKPEETARAFAGGWLRTGDLARIGPGGLVHLVDRVKDMIVRGGENVYSAEVERVFCAHPGVVEVAVVAVPDRLAGERVAAAVVLANGSSDGGAQLRPIWRFARDQLARHKVPELVAVWSGPLPRNPGGKVSKALVRESAQWRVAPR
jgi:long-chain acyl-CoA synthetase